MSTCTIDEYLGAYVLHALEGDEHAAVRAHLLDCPQCTEEVASLAGTASLLALLTREEAEQAVGPDTAPTPAPAARRWPRRAALLAAASLAAAAVAAGTVGPLLGDSAPAAHQTTLHTQGQDNWVKATLTVSPRSAATALHVSIHGVYPDGTCYLIVHGRDGTSATVARWVATPGGNAEVDATTSIPPRDLATVDVVTQSGGRLAHFTMPAPGN